MVDEAGEDALEVEPAADVAGDPVQRLGPMELPADGLLALRRGDDRAEGPGDDRRDLGGEGRERCRRLGHEMEHAPRPVHADDRGGELRSSARQDRQGTLVAVRPGGRELVAGRGRAERLAEDAERLRPLDQPLGPRGVGDRDGPRDQPLVTELPERHEVVVVGIADQRHGALEIGVQVGGLARQPGDLVDQLEVQRVAVRAAKPVRMPRARGRRAMVGATGRERGRGQRRASPARREDRRRCGEVERADLGRGEEPLEVAHPVAAVTALVDPVVAEAAGITPGPDRVRVHAKEACGLGDGQGRVDRA